MGKDMMVAIEGMTSPVEVTTLEAARLVASAFGWSLDLEPGAPGEVRVTAERPGIRITVKGRTADEAAAKLISKLENVRGG